MKIENLEKGRIYSGISNMTGEKWVFVFNYYDQLFFRIHTYIRGTIFDNYLNGPNEGYFRAENFFDIKPATEEEIDWIWKNIQIDGSRTVS